MVFVVVWMLLIDFEGGLLWFELLLEVLFFSFVCMLVCFGVGGWVGMVVFMDVLVMVEFDYVYLFYEVDILN